MTYSERRRSPRIEILGRLYGHSVSMDMPVRVCEMSLGGMAVETPFEFPTGAIHEFRLTLGDGSTVELRGRVVRCKPGPPGDAPVFLSGIQFVDEDPTDGDSTVGELMGRIQ